MGEPASSYHIPVLLHHAIDLLLTDPGGVYVDGTLGGGGHAEELLRRLNDRGRLIGLDRDEDALTHAAQRLAPFGHRLLLVRENFGNLRGILDHAGVPRLNGVLLDLGVSSHQIDEPSKGFSFRSSDRLDMRMDSRQTLDAAAVVREYDLEDLTRVLSDFGEEREARRIARAIVAARALRPLETTEALAQVVERTVGAQFLTKTLARVFQAIRIEVNGELDHLRSALHQAVECLAPGGRMVVISYHSLEDRIVKDFFRTAAATRIPSGHKLVPDTPLQPTLRILTRKPILADDTEVTANPRSRSAKLRCAERL